MHRNKVGYKHAHHSRSTHLNNSITTFANQTKPQPIILPIRFTYHYDNQVTLNAHTHYAQSTISGRMVRRENKNATPVVAQGQTRVMRTKQHENKTTRGKVFMRRLIPSLPARGVLYHLNLPWSNTLICIADKPYQTISNHMET